MPAAKRSWRARAQSADALLGLGSERERRERRLPGMKPGRPNSMHIARAPRHAAASSRGPTSHQGAPAGHGMLSHFDRLPTVTTRSGRAGRKAVLASDLAALGAADSHDPHPRGSFWANPNRMPSDVVIETRRSPEPVIGARRAATNLCRWFTKVYADWPGGGGVVCRVLALRLRRAAS